MLTCLLLALLAPSPDTLRISASPVPPAFDGVASEGEYGAPIAIISRPQGAVRIWAVESQGWVYLAVQLPDTSFYWGDDVVISLDVWGDRGAAPGHDDFQWYFRRVLDSSVVYRGEQGKWRVPRHDPDWRLGAEREGGGWEVRSVSGAGGWSLEFRLDRAYFLEAKAGDSGHRLSGLRRSAPRLAHLAGPCRGPAPDGSGALGRSCGCRSSSLRVPDLQAREDLARAPLDEVISISSR